MKTKPFFRHFAIEAEFDGPNDEGSFSLEQLEDKCQNLMKLLDLSTIKKISHEFSPQGISLVYILTTSHLAVHTWPESGFLHLDLITCSKSEKLSKIEELAKAVFPNAKIVVKEV